MLNLRPRSTVNRRSDYRVNNISFLHWFVGRSVLLYSDSWNICRQGESRTNQPMHDGMNITCFSFLLCRNSRVLLYPGSYSQLESLIQLVDDVQMLRVLRFNPKYACHVYHDFSQLIVFWRLCQWISAEALFKWRFGKGFISFIWLMRITLGWFHVWWITLSWAAACCATALVRRVDAKKICSSDD